MSTNSMIQSPEDQFLHWRQDMERKQEEQARRMKELQGQVERLWHKNDQLLAQIEKSLDLGKDVRDSDRAAQPITSDKGNEHVAPDDVDTPADDALSSGSSPFLSLSPTKNAQESTKTRLCKRPSPVALRHLATNVAFASYLRCSANILHIASSLNSETRWHAFFAPRATRP